MFTTPPRFNKFLRENHLLNEIYEAMDSDDYSDVVMAAIKSLGRGNILLHAVPQYKSEKVSDKHRDDGNAAFKNGDATSALNHYNKALRFAPIKSRSLLLAFSNRSAVLFTMDHFIECLSDIETCFRLGCPPDIVDKLNKRKESATAKLSRMNNLAVMRTSYRKFFQIDKRNAEVPCVSADVQITVKDGMSTITAAKDIKVGTILAIEPCFIGSNNCKTPQIATICRNCYTKSFNVIPCDGCCFIMFCSEKCKRQCQQQYHNVECQIMAVIEATDFSPRTMLMVAGALKFVHMCGTWREAIVESHCIGSKRRSVSNVTQMFDVANKFCILNYDEDNIFVHGNMYETSFVCAKIIDSLDKVPSYLPQSPSERMLAKRALARLMMFLALFAKPSRVFLIEKPALTKPYSNRLLYHGLYPFIGKLKNSCTPNTIVSCADNKKVLLALQPITKGSELTMSHMGHYLDTKMTLEKKNFESMLMYGRVCKCFICTAEWITRNCVITMEQQAAYMKYKMQSEALPDAMPFLSFPVICDMLTCLSDAPYSEEYADVYKDFRGYLVYRASLIPRRTM